MSEVLSRRKMIPFGVSGTLIEIGDIAYIAKSKPLILSSGVEIQNFPIAYQAYGKLNHEKTNAILICHALTGDQYAASQHPVTGKDGWWQNMIGSGKPIDTDKFFVIVTNVIGGCMGSFGPKEIDIKTGKPFGISFPLVTIEDMVAAQLRLITEYFEIDKLLAVIGGSMGGMQALVWGANYSDHVCSILAVATSYRYTAQNIAFHEVGRQAIMADPNWAGGNYFNKAHPDKGLAVARMAAHITYLSEKALHHKFGRSRKAERLEQFSIDFEVEGYLHHQGSRFAQRFDANSYLYLTKAVDYFDLRGESENLSEAFSNSSARFCIVSFSDDWLFPTSEAKEIVQAINATGADVSFVEIKSEHGHDSFLLDNESFDETIKGFLAST